ncbi:MAG TPA: response regulator [Bdellovibrionota bacterium]|jgi:DNA-binding NtrC family response regulator|nr:response regulator [Bdellovibrionota bacterium]
MLTETKFKVAIIDDEPDILDYLSRILTESGHFEVLSFDSAKKAHQALSTTQVDAVLSDLSMPEMDGLTLFASLKRIYPDLPVVFVTGYPGEEHIIKALQLGACDFIEKPFDPDIIVEVMIASAKIGKLRHQINSYLSSGKGEANREQLYKHLQTIQDILVLRAFNHKHP